MSANKRIPDFPEPTFCGLRRWFRFMYEADLLYHPDDPAETIVNTASGEASFTPAECLQLNAAVESMFAFYGDLVYSVGLHFARKPRVIQPEGEATATLLVC